MFIDEREGGLRAAISALERLLADAREIDPRGDVVKRAEGDLRKLRFQLRELLEARAARIDRDLMPAQPRFVVDVRVTFGGEVLSRRVALETGDRDRAIATYAAILDAMERGESHGDKAV